MDEEEKVAPEVHAVDPVLIREHENTMMRLAGMNPESVRKEWAIMAQESSDEWSLAVPSGARSVMDVLYVLGRELEEGKAPSEPEKSAAAIRYVRQLVRSLVDRETGSSSFLPKEFREKTKAFGPSEPRPFLKGLESLDMRADEVLEWAEERYGETVEIAAKETSEGIMILGRWKFEKGEIYVEILDGEGNARVWTNPEGGEKP